MKKKRGAFILSAAAVVLWHPAQSRKEDWAFFCTLDQSNWMHVQEYGCRVCGKITFNSAFIHQRKKFQVCLYHDPSMITLKHDWLPDGTRLTFKRKCSPKDDPLNYGRFLMVKKAVRKHEEIDY
jgi:hypothetical protein